MADVHEGSRVKIADREASADDVKSGLFYNHFRNLVGSVQKLYPTGEAAIDVDLDSLTQPIALRHTDVQEHMKNKWLDSLSEEGRNRLSPQERDFHLRYTVLVAAHDLSPDNSPAPRRATLQDLESAEAAELARRKSRE